MSDNFSALFYPTGEPIIFKEFPLTWFQMWENKNLAVLYIFFAISFIYFAYVVIDIIRRRIKNA